MRAALLAAAMLGGLATGAQAAVIRVEASLAPVDPSSGQLEQRVPNFNPALGTLTGATVSTTAFLSESITVQSNTAAPLPGAAAFNTTFTSNGLGTGAAAPVQAITAPLIPIMFNGTPAARVVVNASLTTTFTVSASALSLSAGSPLIINYTAFARAAPGSGVGEVQDGAHFITLTGNVVADYTYDPAATAVPEPVSMSLLGVELLGMAAARRRPAI